MTSTHRIGFFCERCQAVVPTVAVLLRECTPWVADASNLHHDMRRAARTGRPVSKADRKFCRPRGYQTAADPASLTALLHLMRHGVTLGFTAVDNVTGAVDAFAVVKSYPGAYQLLATGTRESWRRHGLGSLLVKHVQGLTVRNANGRNRCLAYLPESCVDASKFLARRGFRSRLLPDSRTGAGEQVIEFTYLPETTHAGPADPGGRD